MSGFLDQIFPAIAIFCICAIFIIGIYLLFVKDGIFRVFGALLLIFDLSVLVFMFNYAISR